ncbi:uncharacterized protein LOC112342258 [Selaginella moellendorffii]|uniref:uncharacterized protein LOC112342258 n=1 Tax=Selaginella moellendorffii TaxID=88036 RepID=UPI000D1CF801|nr:uncharacterized protein LOC112342258 [Selaginella moellendorffii]|eukprot:XP_024519594.1 uncharacterized protein LOC112342258 [Selaginella moellendorffii]
MLKGRAANSKTPITGKRTSLGSLGDSEKLGPSGTAGSSEHTISDQTGSRQKSHHTDSDYLAECAAIDLHEEVVQDTREMMIRAQHTHQLLKELANTPKNTLEKLVSLEQDGGAHRSSLATKEEPPAPDTVLEPSSGCLGNQQEEDEAMDEVILPGNTGVAMHKSLEEELRRSSDGAGEQKPSRAQGPGPRMSQPASPPTQHGSPVQQSCALNREVQEVSGFLGSGDLASGNGPREEVATSRALDLNFLTPITECMGRRVALNVGKTASGKTKGRTCPNPSKNRSGVTTRAAAAAMRAATVVEIPIGCHAQESRVDPEEEKGLETPNDQTRGHKETLEAHRTEAKEPVQGEEVSHCLTKASSESQGQSKRGPLSQKFSHRCLSDLTNKVKTSLPGSPVKSVGSRLKSRTSPSHQPDREPQLSVLQQCMPHQTEEGLLQWDPRTFAKALREATQNEVYLHQDILTAEVWHQETHPKGEDRNLGPALREALDLATEALVTPKEQEYTNSQEAQQTKVQEEVTSTWKEQEEQEVEQQRDQDKEIPEASKKVEMQKEESILGKRAKPLALLLEEQEEEMKRMGQEREREAKKNRMEKKKERKVARRKLKTQSSSKEALAWEKEVEEFLHEEETCSEEDQEQQKGSTAKEKAQGASAGRGWEKVEDKCRTTPHQGPEDPGEQGDLGVEQEQEGCPAQGKVVKEIPHTKAPKTKPHAGESGKRAGTALDAKGMAKAVKLGEALSQVVAAREEEL